MDADYPAAHSMDTTWFAVDREGHVAIFSSGEAGAVPEEALTEESDPVAVELEAYFAANGCIYVPAQGHEFAVAPPQHTDPSYRQDPLREVLMFLASLDPVLDDLRARRAQEVRSSSGTAVIWSSLDKNRYQELHAAGYCLHCRQTREDERERAEAAPARGSLFHYEHQTDNWISGPYALETQPAQPLTLEQLPPRLRSALQGARFQELSFRETPLIQPVEHFTCVSWDCAWLSPDGSEARPIPGREAEYEAVYIAWLRSPDDEDYDMAPPPGWTVEKEEQALRDPPPAPPGDSPVAPAGRIVGIIRRFFGR